MNAVVTTFLTLTPPSQLLTKVTVPATESSAEKTNFVFPLQTKAWLKVQGVARAALAFPLNKDTFTNLYGSFTNEQTVLDAVGVLNTIHKILEEYGDPETLVSSIPAFQAAKQAPKPIYGNAVWLAFHTQTTAQNIASLLKEGLKDIGEVSDPKERLEDLTELLTGTGGITDQANTLAQQVRDFSKKTTNFYVSLNSSLTGKTNSLQAYLNEEGNVLELARNIVKTDLADLAKLRKQIHKLNEEYIGFVIAASASPIFLLVPFVGVFLAIADATTFGILAEKTKEALDKARKELSKEEVAEQKKAALVHVLESFNQSVLNVKTDGDDFVAAIETMLSGWTEFNAQITNQLKSITPDDLKDWPKFLQQVNFQSALDAWNKIAAKAEQFAQAGFISFQSQKSSSKA